MSKNNHWNFQSSIALVLGDRKKYPWGENLGLSHSQINGMFNHGIIPKGDTIGLICETERVSGTWLTTGIDGPFEVLHFYDADDAREWLSDYIRYTSGATLYLVCSGVSVALVTHTQVSKTTAQEKTCRYDEINVVCGIDQHTLATVDLAGIALRRLDLYDDEFKKLVQGETGNQTLLKLMERSRPFNPGGDQIADTGGDYNTTKTGSSQRGGADLTPDEEALLKKYRALNADNRHRLQAITSALDVTLDADVSDPT